MPGQRECKRERPEQWCHLLAQSSTKETESYYCSYKVCSTSLLVQICGRGVIVFTITPLPKMSTKSSAKTTSPPSYCGIP